MKYDKFTNDCYNLYTIKTDRFKTCQLEIIFRNECSKENITFCALLFDILMESNKKYNSKKVLARKQQELYNLGLYAVNSRVGNTIISNIVAEFLDPTYMDKGALDNIIELTFDMLFNPNVINEAFDEETFNRVKKRLEIEIESLKENPKQMSILRAFNHLDNTSPRSFNSCGDAEILKNITPKKLYEFYKRVLEESSVDIYFIGNVDELEVDKLVKKYAKFTSIKTDNIQLYLEEIKKHNIIEKEDKRDVTQMQLVQIYAPHDMDSYEVNYCLPLFNMLWGSGSLESKVYKGLRGDNALCYNVITYNQKYDRVIILHTAIDKKNYKSALNIIKKSLSSMCDGEITIDELNNVKNIMINSLNMACDNPGRLIDNYLFSNIADLPDIESRIEEFKKVTIEDLVRVAKKITLILNYRMVG